MRVIGVLLALAGGLCADTIYDTLGAPGRTSAGAIGQTFNVPEFDTVLTRFAIEADGVNLGGGPGYALIQGHVAEWDLSTPAPIGPFLFSSDPLSIPAGTGPGIQPRTFVTGGLQLDPTKTYVLLFARLNVVQTSVEWGLNNGANFPGGNTVTAISVNQPVWMNQTGDTSFRAVFTAPPNNPIPEPGTLALFGAALIGFVIWRRRL